MLCTPHEDQEHIVHIAQHLSFHLTMRLGRGCSFKQSLLFLSFLSQPLDEESKSKSIQRLNAPQSVFTCLIIVYP